MTRARGTRGGPQPAVRGHVSRSPEAIPRTPRQERRAILAATGLEGLRGAGRACDAAAAVGCPGLRQPALHQGLVREAALSRPGIWVAAPAEHAAVRAGGPPAAQPDGA